jgi:hypothetical protein
MSDPIFDQKYTAMLAAQKDFADYARTPIVVTPPPPAFPRFPNAPGNLPVLSDYNFSAIPGEKWVINGQKRPDITQDLSAPVSPPYTLQFTYPEGMPGGEAPATVSVPLAARMVLYAGFYFRFNAEWQGHNSNVNKLAHIFFVGGGQCYLAAYGSPGGPYHLRTNVQIGGERWLKSNIDIGLSTPVRMGAWHCAEWLLDFSARRVAFALDNVTIGDYSDVALPSYGLGEFQLSPTWGGVGDTKRRRDTLQIDHILLKG